MITSNVPVITSQAAASVNSSPIHTVNTLSCSAQITCTGSSAGTLKLQASDDSPIGGLDPVNWNDISGATVTVSGAGSFLIPKTDLCYEYIRVVYTNSGTGNISANLKTSGI